MNAFGGEFPQVRQRRTRSSSFARKLVRENLISTDDLIYPIFLIDGTGKEIPVDSMPDICRISIDNLSRVASDCLKKGINAVALFPNISSDKKSEDGKEAYNEKGLIPRALNLLKRDFPELGVITDAALDPYTTHGQDGVVDETGYVLNDPTVTILQKQALCYAAAGADIIAPSDMMDGRIKGIRSALELEGFVNTILLAYSAKYASSFYGPFRDAVGSAKTLQRRGKETYQLDIGNISEALREVELDLKEGADIVMVKPGLPYLDVVRAITTEFKVPTFVYQVSGEYSMLKAAFQNNWLDQKSAMLESLTSFKRAGASAILTYFALEAADEIKKRSRG